MLQILRDANALQGSLKYNYDAVDADIREQVIEAALDIRQRINRAQGDLIATGQKLIETKAVLPHGQFEDWVQTEFGFSQRTAQNFMNVAERFATKSETVSLFSDSALYLLAAPSTPAAAIEAATAEASATGVSPTKERVKEIIAEHKPPRDLDANETSAVIWRAIRSSGQAEPDAQLNWLDHAHINDFSKLLNAGVKLVLQTFNDELVKVRKVLQQQCETRARVKPTTAQNAPKSASTPAASTNTPASTPSRHFEASTPVTAWAERAEAEPVPLTYQETRKLIIDAMKASGDDPKVRYKFLMDMTYWRDWLDQVPAGRTLDSEVHAKAWRDLIAVLKAELGLDDYGRPATQPAEAEPSAIRATAQRLLDGTTADRIFLAKSLLSTISVTIDDLSIYGQLTGKFLDIPPAERALRKMVEELRTLVGILGE